MLFEFKPGFFSKVYAQYCSARNDLSRLKKTLPSFIRKPSVNPKDKKLLVTSIGWYDAKTEGVYAKALETLGYDTYIITRWDPCVARIFKLFGINKVYFYPRYLKNISLREAETQARRIVQDTLPEDILDIRRNGISIGKYAASSFMRITRSSKITFQDKKMLSVFTGQLIRSLRAAAMAENILQDINPQLVLVNDRGYTPVGQIFDASLKRGISVIQRCGSHKSGSEVLKRYFSLRTNNVHHCSLSEESWNYVKNMSWGEEKWKRLYNELSQTYKSGDWFSEVGTQFNKKIYSRQQLTEQLRLNPDKKTAVIFAHMFWDATFFGGESIFGDYYEWFVNVLRAAGENKNLNWIIKIHPANIVKAKRDGYRGEHKELAAVREVLGRVPGHIRVLPPESDINTFSLFSLMDYCLTVRGTIGIEAAAFGVNTLTAGSGRYDRRGFTRDFDSKEEYLACLKNLEKLPAMDKSQIELARRFAYGIFILRPLNLDLLEQGYLQDKKATKKFNPLFKTRSEFENSGFVGKFREFVLSGKADFIERDRAERNAAGQEQRLQNL